MQPLPLAELFRMYHQMYQGLLKLGFTKEEALKRVADVMMGGSNEQG